MDVRGNGLRQVFDKRVIPREKLTDEELDKIVAETTVELSKTEHNSNNIETSSSESSATIDKQGVHSHKLAQPKRPMNAFMVWGQCIRRELHNRYTNVQNAMLSKALGRVWKSLDCDQKKPYVERANTIKANHKRDYPNYRYQPRRIQERRARQLKDATKCSGELERFILETGVLPETQYPRSDLVPSFSGAHENACVSHPNAPMGQQAYVIHEPYLTSGGNAEAMEVMQSHQHEVPYNSQPQESTIYYDHMQETPTILEYDGQISTQEQGSTQYLPYGQPTVMVEEENNFMYAQSVKYSGPAETSDQNKEGQHNRQPHQYYAPAHSDTMYYLAPKVGGAEGTFPLEF